MNLEELKQVLPNPISIVDKLNQYIIGQDEAKKMLALLLLNRAILKLKKAGRIDISLIPEKSNVMLIGPTGTGKTALIKALAEISGIDIPIFDVTSITSAGFIGNKVEDILLRYVNIVTDGFRYKYQKIIQEMDSKDPAQARYNFTEKDFVNEIVNTGIIYLDEIDKIAAKTGEFNHGLDVSGEMVQNELLKVLEGADISLAPSRGAWPDTGIKSVNTENIMFIVGGAFVGLSEIIYKRLTKGNKIGFGANFEYSSLRYNKEELLKYVTTDDLIEFGMKPELLGRLPLRATLDPMTPDMLEKVITHSKNSVLKQYLSLFSLFKIELMFTEGAIKEVALKASTLKMGARSLKLLFNAILSEDIFNIFNTSDSELVMTAKDVKHRLKNKHFREKDNDV